MEFFSFFIAGFALGVLYSVIVTIATRVGWRRISVAGALIATAGGGADILTPIVTGRLFEITEECIFLALAIRLEPETMRRVRRVVAMGTGGLGRGNVTPVAEFNIWQDARRV